MATAAATARNKNFFIERSPRMLVEQRGATLRRTYEGRVTAWLQYGDARRRLARREWANLFSPRELRQDFLLRRLGLQPLAERGHALEVGAEQRAQALLLHRAGDAAAYRV